MLCRLLHPLGWGGGCSLTDKISVSHYHPVLECAVLIFALDHRSFLSIVVSFTLSLPSKAQRASLRVGLPFNSLHTPLLQSGNPQLWLHTDLIIIIIIIINV